MTEEQIKQTSKITEFARNMVKQSDYPEDLQDHIIATCMVVVTEATKELEKENAELKELMRTLIANVPNTYSGTNIELQQKKMFSFQDAVNKAEQFLKENSTYERIQKAKYNYTD